MSASLDPIAQLAQSLDAVLPGGARLADDGLLHLNIEGGPAIAVGPTEQEGELLFQAALASLSHPQDVLLMTAALACNLHQAATGGGAIGLDLDSLVLNFSWRVSLADREAPADALLGMLDAFCDKAKHLYNQLAEVADGLSEEERDAITQRMVALDSPAGGAHTHGPDSPSFA